MIPAFGTNLAQKKAELAILKTLVYFDIFDYPLSEKDIKNFIGCYIDEETFAWRIGRQALATLQYPDVAAYEETTQVHLHYHRYRLGMEDAWPDDDIEEMTTE